jgi:lysyl-tRNA synthetase, class I
MQWLNTIVDDLVNRHPEGDILIESGGSPSGTYHIGHLRELVIADAIMLELGRRGRQAKHIYFVDDLDALRKVPINVPADFDKYLGFPLSDVPSPIEEKDSSYANYFLQGLKDATKTLNIEVEFIYSHSKYREGFFVPAIERSLERVAQARNALETISGRKLDEHWTPIQVLEDGRLKNRKFLSIDQAAKKVHYLDADGVEQNVRYDKGEVKLDWRLDWPGRWWLLGVDCEPSGRDHMTKGSSYDTGVQIMKDVYEAEAPYPVSYDFINMAGDNKKMSASKGTGLDVLEAAELMPPEVMRYFILRSAPLKRLYFDPVEGIVQLMDDFAAFASKNDRTDGEEQLLQIATRGLDHKTVSRVPFSLLVASYQAALKDPTRTLEIISRTEYKDVAVEDATIIQAELRFIDAWLENRAPETVKFALTPTVSAEEFTEQEQQFLKDLAAKIETAPDQAQGDWFHTAIYEFKDTSGLEPSQLFSALYRALVGKTSGPRAGWFLSILPRDWLVKRLRLEA